MSALTSSALLDWRASKTDLLLKNLGGDPRFGAFLKKLCLAD